mmetsp:Transcript_182188/g.577681  ORF Transcript_182188/g.577681 Transcript_182188/m.577681 type:complete len:174 (-) Transcript_182188:83-604(-)
MGGLQAMTGIAVLLLAGCFDLVRAGNSVGDEIVVHAKVPRSIALRAGRGAGRHRKGGLELLQELGREEPVVAGAQTAEAQRQLDLVGEVDDQTNVALHNSQAKGSMLSTQMLSSSQSLFVVAKMAETVKRMREQVEALEEHEKLCRKKVADLESSNAESPADLVSADSPDVVF